MQLTNDHDGFESTMPPLKRMRYDTTDRMLHQTHFDKLQQMTRQFTLDACCDNRGYNSHCELFCSPNNSFLQFDCSHHHVWINPPFQYEEMRNMIRHYQKCKRSAPCTTSACILVPAWATTRLQNLLSSMHIIYTFPAYEPVMTVPAIPHGSDRLVFHQGLPFALHVFYDPVASKQSTLAKSPTLPLALLAPCYVAGNKAQVNVGGGFTGTMAIDTLASRNFIDVHYAKQIGLKIRPHPSWLSNEIVLGDNSTKSSLGVVHVCVSIGHYTDFVWCDVLELPASFQLILGQKWLNDKQCILNFKTKTCTLWNHSRKFVLDCSQGFASTSLASPSSSFQCSAELPILSALQAKRMLRKKPCLHTNYSFLVLVQSLPDKLALSTPLHLDVQCVLDDHTKVLSDPPNELPPTRDVKHNIKLAKDASPPFKPVYRLSLKERKEVDTTIQDLLTKGYIQPSTSPYGAPILFVGKKDGSLRMCVDYRALNKLTIKNRYPLPRIDDLLDQLFGAKYFTTLDLASGYHQIRINDPDIPKTAFRTPLGHFEWRVMPFGLCNAPATFQNAMNNLFGHRIGKYVLVYMDDILIFSKTKEEHIQHLNEVLTLLEQHKYYVNKKKCHFFQTEIKFLGHTVSAHGLQVDPDKIAVIKNWQRPTDKTSIRSLLGFGNYFRRFIYRYSEMVLPLLELTKQNTPTIWTDACDHAFTSLKTAIINAPVLKHPDLSRPFQLICDASNYASGAILVQDNHPCAFASKKFLPAECNYTTEEKELLAIIQALKLFRCYLEGNQFTIVTDHNPLKYFDTKQDLSPRQARWAQYLSRFNYTWEWIKGTTNPADFLSRNPAHAAMLCAVTTRAQVGKSDSHPSLSRPRKRKHKYSAQHMPLSCPSSSTDTPPESLVSSPLEHAIDKELIVLGYSKDPWFQNPNNTIVLMHKHDLWYKGKAIVLPKYLHLRKWAIQEFHEPPYSGHVGFAKTMQNLKATYWWHGMSTHVHDFIKSCHSCQRNKPSLQKPAGLLQPLPIPSRPWSSISMDLIVELPTTSEGHNAIVRVVDRLTKMTHFFPCTTHVTALQLATLFLSNVFRLHGIPNDIVTDRDPKFVSSFWREFCRLLGTRQNLSTSYHPQTDGQTERFNRILEEMLRHYVSPHQSDWNTYLPLCEFAINNSVNESTGYTPFYLAYGYHPITPANSLIVSSVPAAHQLHQQMLQNLHLAQQQLQAARQRQKHYADAKRRMVQFDVGTNVLLSTQHIGLYCAGSPKLLPRYIGPFKILKKIGEVAYQLDLPSVLKIHNVFHVSRLRAFSDDGRVQPPPLPILLDGELEYEVEKVYAHRDVKVGKSLRREYLVRWKGYGVEHDEFVPESNLGNAKRKVSEYWATL